VKNGVHTAQWPPGISGGRWTRRKSYKVETLKKIKTSPFNV
jgi:hypothetical protein